MTSWVSSFFGVDERFMPHGHCYLWQPDILWTHVTADALTATAYIAIPICITVIAWRHAHTAGASASIALLFAAFIILCGLTHLFNIYVIWQPAYEFQSYLKAITAIVSLVTAVVVISKTRYLFHLLSIEASNKAIDRIEIEHQKRESQLEKIYGASESRELRIIELKEEVNALLMAQGKAIKYEKSRNQ